jgi:tetratricopeptide (TPR) repeat protein
VVKLDANLEIDHQMVDGDEGSHVRVRPDACVDPRAALDEAIAMHEMGDYDRALAILEPAARVDGDSRVIALWLMARCHLQKGRPEHAARCLEWALLDAETEISRIALLFELGETLEAAGALEDALECFLLVLRHMPKFRAVGDRIRALGG